MNNIKHLSNATPLRDHRYGTVYELAGIATGLVDLGLAWVVVDAQARSPLHMHTRMSEVYFVVQGSGVMELKGQEYLVGIGSCISITPGIPHAIRATGDGPLFLVVATSPAYDEADDLEMEE